MSRQTEDSPTLPGFVPERADDGLETAELTRGGDVSTATVDVLASLDKDDTLLSMLDGTMESPHVLPLVYADPRGRLSDVSDMSRELGELRARLGSISLEASDLRLHARTVDNEVSTLRNENDALRDRLRHLEQDRHSSHSHSPAASTAASLQSSHHSGHRAAHADQCCEAPPLRREQRPVLPPRTAASTSVPPFAFPGFPAALPGASASLGSMSPMAANPLNLPAPAAAPSLVTAWAMPMPVVPSNAQVGRAPGVNEEPGPYCPGLMPLTTMLAPFTDVISYRTYRLRDTRAEVTLVESGHITRLKRRFDDLYPGFEPFHGTKPIALLEFLNTLRDGFNALEASEAVASLLLTYYLDGSAKTLYATQRSSGFRSEAGALAATWPYLVNELIKRYLTDDVLQSAYEQVTDARQKSGEDENAFADRIAKAARVCCNVFRDRELVNYYIRGLLPATRDAVTERVRQLSVNEQGDLTVARRVAVAEGNTFRARQKVSNPSTPTKAKHRSNTMIMAEGAESPPWSPFRRDPNMSHMFTDPYWADLRARDPEHAHRIACELENVLYAGSTDPRKIPMSPADSEASFADPALQRPYSPPPKLTEEQVEKARLVIPTEYWGLVCWACRGNGHTTFTCGYLTVEQRIYFAYKYYVYQCQSNPHMAEWYKQRRAARQKRNASGTGAPPSARVPQPPRSPGRTGPGRPSQGTPYPNRRERDSRNRAASFSKGGGVYITIHVSDEPTHPAWAHSDSESDDANESAPPGNA